MQVGKMMVVAVVVVVVVVVVICGCLGEECEISSNAKCQPTSSHAG
jgi:hypothetical protein